MKEMKLGDKIEGFTTCQVVKLTLETNKGNETYYFK
jgi:hypothetical protein